MLPAILHNKETAIKNTLNGILNKITQDLNVVYLFLPIVAKQVFNQYKTFFERLQILFSDWLKML